MRTLAVRLPVLCCVLVLGLAACAGNTAPDSNRPAPAATSTGAARLLNAPFAVDGPVALWPCDEGSGDVLHDAAFGHDAKIGGAKFVKMEKGFALKFDGTTNCVDCGVTPDLNPLKAMTLEAWVRPEGSFEEGLHGILGKSLDSFGVCQNPSNQYRFHVASVENLARSKPAKAGWAHIVGTFDGKTICVYVNGELSESQGSAFEQNIAAKTPFFIGFQGDDPVSTDSGFFCGLLDELRVYNRALTAEEVKKNYEATRAQFPDIQAPGTAK